MFKKQPQTLPEAPASTSKKCKGMSRPHYKPLHGGTPYAYVNKTCKKNLVHPFGKVGATKKPQMRWFGGRKDVPKVAL